MDATDPRMVLDRLVAARGESYAALSKMLRRNPAYLQQFIRRGTPRMLAERDRKLLAAYFRVDEAMLGGAPALPGRRVGVRRLDVAASAGAGGLIDSDAALGEESFDRAFLDRLGVRSNALAMLRAQGESMEPLIEDGDEILVDESDRRVGGAGAIYVIRLDGALMVKRVSREGDMLRVRSDNMAFPAMALQRPGDVEILGRVVWLSRALI